MVDREQVINALEHCINDNCKGCPYQQKGTIFFGVISCDDIINEDTIEMPISLINQVFELLKTQ